MSSKPQPDPRPERRVVSVLRPWLQRVGRALGAVANSRPAGMLVALLVGASVATGALHGVNRVLLPMVRTSLAAAPGGEREVHPLGSEEFLVVRTQGDTSSKVVAPAMEDVEGWEVRELSRYFVKKDLGEAALESCLMIEVRTETRGAGQRVVADLAYRDREDRWIALPWWETGGIAESNQLVAVEPQGGWPWVLHRLSFPATTSSLVTWVQEHWEQITKQLNPIDYGKTGGPEDSPGAASRALDLKPSLLRQQVGPELERVLAQDFGHLQRDGAVVALRILNGRVQWITMVAFGAALAIMLARWLVLVRAERPVARSLYIDRAGSAEENDEWWEDAQEGAVRRNHDFERRWGQSSAALGVWIGALSAIKRNGDSQNVPDYTESFASLEEERRAFRGFSLAFLVGAIPALGFIGTVLGIGDALMGTGAVLSDSLAKQQSGVATVALSLGLAFDTTFVSLVLSLVTLFLSSWLTSAEEGILSTARQRCLAELVHGSERPSDPLVILPHEGLGVAEELPSAARPERAPRDPYPASQPAAAEPELTPNAEKPAPARFLDAPDDYLPLIRARRLRGSHVAVLALQAAACSAGLLFVWQVLGSPTLP